MKKFLGAALLALLPVAAFAQTPVQLQDAGGLTAATTFVQGQSNGATSCNTVSETAAQDTITITPPSGMYAYVTQLYVNNTTDATGVTQTETVLIGGVSNAGTAANLNVGSALTTVQGMAPPQIIPFNPPLRSSAPGTAITFTPSATQSAHNYLCMFASGFFRAN